MKSIEELLKVFGDMTIANDEILQRIFKIYDESIKKYGDGSQSLALLNIYWMAIDDYKSGIKSPSVTTPELKENYDKKFSNLNRQIKRQQVDIDYALVYDFVKRWMDKHGLGLHVFIQVFMMGYLQGQEEARK